MTGSSHFLSPNGQGSNEIGHFNSVCIEGSILTGFPEIQPRPIRDYDFLGSEITKSIFFNFFRTKSSTFISNQNDDCFQLSFEVYNVCVAQKLQISELLTELFFAWILAPGSRPLQRPPKVATSNSLTSTGYQILAEDLSFQIL